MRRHYVRENRTRAIITATSLLNVTNFLFLGSLPKIFSLSLISAYFKLALNRFKDLVSYMLRNKFEGGQSSKLYKF